MDIYLAYRKEIVDALKVIWKYMRLNEPIVPCDLIIGCGCANKMIPVRCAELYKTGYAPKILFAGGKGKITSKEFSKSEAEIFKDIALDMGVSERDIILETKSTNTGDNFRFALDIIKERKMDVKKILIVHNPMNERRTLSSAKAILKDKEVHITSPITTFDEYIANLELSEDKIIDKISVIVGDIQRLIIYPMVGFQVNVDVPDDVIASYQLLKKLGFDKYIITKDEIDAMIEKHGLKPGQQKIYFC